MMKLALVSALVASASAFSPSMQKQSSFALSASPYENEIGVQVPTGFFDPMGFLNDVPKEGFDNLREIEIKHGRVAMLAVTGYLTTAAGIRFPGAENIPDGFAAWGALASTDDGKFVLLQMAAFFVAAEAINRDAFGKAEFPGDYRNGALDFGWDKQSDAWKKSKRTIELNQGRAAQMGILGLMTHEAMGSSILPGGYLPGH